MSQCNELHGSMWRFRELFSLFWRMFLDD